MDLEKPTPNIYTTTKLRGCNPSFVVTSDGVVIIDTPQLPTRAVAMRAEAESHGQLRYLINTEHHVDHIFGNYWFKGVPVVNHQGLYDNFMDPNAELDPFAYALEAVPTDDPEAAPLIPDRDVYYQDPNKGTIVFTGDLTLKVGDHTFHCLWTPGHTPGQLAVHVPKERAVFTGDTIFNEVQTWLMTSNVDEWLEALERIRALDVDHLIPGHGPVTTLKARRRAARCAARLEGGGRRRGREGLDSRGDDRPGPVRRPVRPGRRRAGLHDGSHPEQERRVVVGQADCIELQQGSLGPAQARPAAASSSRVRPANWIRSSWSSNQIPW